jgi:hypothetical protein
MSDDLKPFRELVGYVVADYDAVCGEMFVWTPLYPDVGQAFDHCNQVSAGIASGGYKGPRYPVVMEVRMQTP